MTESAPGELTLAEGFRRCGLPAREIWIRYVALGGNADEVSVAGQLHGLVELSAGEFNVLAHTVNEELDELPPSERGLRVPYLPLAEGQRLHGSQG